MNPKINDFIAETVAKLESPGLLLMGAKKDGTANVMTIG